jgi:xylan 1,4-beta-xylosidase
MDFVATTSLEFNPKNANEEAGLILLNNGQHFDILVKRTGNKRILYVKLQFGSIVYSSKDTELKEGPVQLRIKGEGASFTFSYSQGKDFIDIEKVDSRYLSTETVGWFTGVYVGIYASGNGKKSQEEASYDYFEYTGN